MRQHNPREREQTYAEAREQIYWVWSPGFAHITRTIRNWEHLAAAQGQALTGHSVAHVLAGSFDFGFNPGLWRAVAMVADYEIDAISRRPDNLVAALMGLDENLR